MTASGNQKNQLQLGDFVPSLVVGLDTGSNRLHMYSSDGGHQHVFIDTRKAPDPDERRTMLFRQARAIFKTLPRGTVIACEEPLSLQNGKTTRILGLSAGAIWAAHVDCDVFWTWVNVSTWKRDTVGKGNATKGEVMDWVHTAMNLDFTDEGPQNSDYYDAAAICWHMMKRFEDA
jgi:Holliday junction resolvasome RuvABC endonuclease subunit